jgi:hypothetical protein
MPVHQIQYSEKYYDDIYEVGASCGDLGWAPGNSSALPLYSPVLAGTAVGCECFVEALISSSQLERLHSLEEHHPPQSLLCFAVPPCDPANGRGRQLAEGKAAV